ncbi:CbiX/SirB N-terminal domain-containing protein [Methylomonas sp. EFPC1]|uniref:CbiX/SirB N-terminal domain-containing protein n=1 Tax=Methylomonas defluvii TaxID=3045149 RepID=A0ABU4UH77_9GAMM|nr:MULTISPECIES: CbiX/SirB N-terminal domain-containing protein [unclassified Methylomonas]MDX8128837.1 CbiX/SirB N-terminal domain-containing protein [Methylomonas sp. OY6]QBC28464.1 cobalamin biosynthesis protein CbiX [Methylomonas sp. LW13]QSB00138.1 CbiX/SirB N-terminal domain-containing protein [Methylomonas sp. EFPC1]
MTHLLVVAHGSRREDSNLEIRELIEKLRLMTTRFAAIDCAFLEIAELTVAQGLRQQIAQGARQIVVMPYFLSAGRHVSIDIPEQVQRIRDTHPQIDIRIANHLGATEKIGGIVLDLASLAI